MATVEIPDGLHSWLMERAAQTGRPLEALIEEILLRYQADWMSYLTFLDRAFCPIDPTGSKEE